MSKETIKTTIKIKQSTYDRAKELPEGVFICWRYLINPLLRDWLDEIEDNPEEDTNLGNRKDGSDKMTLTFPLEEDIHDRIRMLPRYVLNNKSAKIDELVCDWLEEKEKIIQEKKERWQ